MSELEPSSDNQGCLVKVLCVLEDGCNAESAMDALLCVQEKLREIPREVNTLTNIGVIIVTASQAFADEMAKQPEIKSVEPDGEALIQPIEGD